MQDYTNLDVEGYGCGGHNDDEGLPGEEREDQTPNCLTQDRSHHPQLTS